MSDETTEQGRYLVWMWWYGSLFVEPFATLRAAVESAQATEDNGDGSLERIEGATEDEIAAVRAQIRTEDEAQAAAEREAERARLVVGPRLVVWLKAPERERGERPWSDVAICYGEQAAEAVAEHWRDIVGADRVKVAAKRPGR